MGDFIKILAVVRFHFSPFWLHSKSPAERVVGLSQYISQALSAAPPAVAKEASVVRMGMDGSMKTVRAGTNGFTCMIMGTDKMCNDANSMEFIHAMMMHQPPPNKVGMSYMLAGDKGASNTDPYAMAKTADNHWVVTGPHIMIFGPPSKTLGYTGRRKIRIQPSRT